MTNVDARGALSDITQRLQHAISVHAKGEKRCSIVSNSIYRDPDKERYERFTTQVRMQCDLDPFKEILHELENGNPYLFVDQMTLMRQRPGYVLPGHAPLPQQDIRFNLSGYLSKRARAANSISFLNRKKRETPSMLSLLNDLGKRLPDESELERVSVDEQNHIDIQGMSNNATRFIELLQKSELLANPKVQGNILQDPRTKKDRFNIALEFRSVAKAR